MWRTYSLSSGSSWSASAAEDSTSTLQSLPAPDAQHGLSGVRTSPLNTHTHTQSQSVCCIGLFLYVHRCCEFVKCSGFTWFVFPAFECGAPSLQVFSLSSLSLAVFQEVPSEACSYSPLESHRTPDGHRHKDRLNSRVSPDLCCF